MKPDVHCTPPKGNGSDCCLWPGQGFGCQGVGLCTGATNRTRPPCGSGLPPGQAPPSGPPQRQNLNMMRDIKAALQGKIVRPDGSVNHDSAALTPHLTLFVVTYDTDIAALNNAELVSEGIIDGLSFWLGGPSQRQTHSKLTSLVGEIRRLLPSNFPIFTGGYVTYSSIGWIEPAPFYDLLSQSISMYDSNDIQGFYTFAGSVLQQMNSSLWKQWDLPGHLEKSYFPHLGSAHVEVSSGGVPVAKAIATVHYNRTTHVTRKETDESGAFQFGGWVGVRQAAPHTVTVVAAGFETTTAVVQLKAGTTVDVSIKLKVGLKSDDDDLNASYTTTVVFEHSTTAPDGQFFPCIRVLSAVWLPTENPSSTGVVLAFAECRRWVGDGCEPAGLPHPPPTVQVETNRFVCMRRSTDGGRSFGLLQPNITKMRSGNAAAVTAGSKVLLFFDAIDEARPMVMESSDRGLTFWPARPVLPTMTPGFPNICGPGTGAVMLPSGAPGGGPRITLALYASFAAPRGEPKRRFEMAIVYSDDMAQTFHVGQTAIPYLAAPQLAALPGMGPRAVMLYARCADDAYHNHGAYSSPCNLEYRGVALSTNGGEAFAPTIWSTSLQDSNCQGSAVSSGTSLLVSGDDSRTTRMNMTVKTSRNTTVFPPMFEEAQLISRRRFAETCKENSTWTCGTGYSTLFAAGRSRVGLLWESGVSDCVGASCSILLSWLDVDHQRDAPREFARQQDANVHSGDDRHRPLLAAAAPPAWTFPAGERQLFLTEYGIASTSNLVRTMHRPAKKGCVIRPAVNATTLQISGTPQVRSSPVWIEEEQRFRFMVMGADGDNPEPARWYTSPDGVQWAYETLANSTSVPGLSLYNIVYDVSEPDRSARYKSNLPPSPVFPVGGMAVSGDGIQWRFVPVGQYIPTSDEHSLSLDPKSHRFIYTVKRFGKHGRAVALATTMNFWDKNWTDLGIVFETDDLDQVIGREEIEKRLGDRTRTQPMCIYSAEERNTSANTLACNRVKESQPPWTEPWSQFSCSGACHNATCPTIPHCMKTTPAPCYFGPKPCYNVDICEYPSSTQLPVATSLTR